MDIPGRDGYFYPPAQIYATIGYNNLSNAFYEMNYQRLIKDCLNGRPDAQRELYEHFAEGMLAVCYRYTKSMTDAEDVLQEGFIKVFKNLHQYKSEGEFGGWVRRIMVNTALNFLKQNSRYQSDLSFLDNSSMHPVTNDDPEMRMNAKDLAEMIRQLPTGYQTIFNMHAVEGYTHVEIGKLLGINEGTSRSQYSRARTLLITWLKKHSEESKKENYVRP